jgi:SAM-dependent methyltransferase
MSTLHPHYDHVARYYDHNTQRFLRLGGSGEIAAIHRKIWAPGVESAEEAFLYLNELVAQRVEPVLPPLPTMPRLLDLGCGVGGTTTWLADNLEARVTGVTNSVLQRKMAEERAVALGLDRQCRFIWGDFQHLPCMGSFHAAYAIESFIHATEPGRFFDAAIRRLVHGGRLVICDDFLVDEPLTRQAKKWIRRFKRGWHANSLLTYNTIVKLAESAGFELLDAIALTPYLRFHHPVILKLMQTVGRLPLHSHYWDNLSGGAALQVCVKNGWTQYLALTWENHS